MPEKLIIAHRGASDTEVENTLSAFAKAMEAGADMIELDVRKTKDNVLVVIHDEAYLGKLVRELNFVELSTLSQNQVPALEQVLQLTAGKIKLDVEAKEAGYEQLLGDLLLKYFSSENLIVSSFSEKFLATFKQLFFSVKTGLIIGVKEYGKVLRLILSSGFRKKFDSFQINFQLWKAIGKFIFTPDKPLFIWTVDGDKEINRFLKDKKISGIITNRPSRALQLRALANVTKP